MTVLDKIKIEVETPPTGLPNLVRNPAGLRGGWGWVTPNAGSKIVGSGGLRLSTTPSQAVVAYTENYACSPGDWTGGRVDLGQGTWTTNHTIRIRVQYLDATKVLVTNATQSAAMGLIGSWPLYAPTSQAPAGTAYVRFRVDMYGNTAGTTNPAAGSAVTFRYAMLTKSATNPGTSFSYVSPITWTDVTGSIANTISTDAPALEPGLLSGTIVGSSNAALILAGKQIRVSTWSGTAWEQFYEGTLGDCPTTYLPQETVTLTATDNVTRLGKTKKKYGVGTIDELPYVLEGNGVPWNTGNVGGNQVPSATVVAANDNASLLDQVAITRDSDNGYAWVDRFNVLNVFRRADLSTTPAYTFNSTGVGATAYGSIEIGKSAADSVVNTVSVTFLRNKGVTTKEVPYGPYTDQDSIDAYGPLTAEYVLQGVTDTKAAMASFGAAVLAANATPTTRVKSITIPIRTDTQRLMAATIGHYDVVRVSYGSVVVNQDLRVVGIKREITPIRSGERRPWPDNHVFLLTLTLAPPATYALPKGKGSPALRVAHVPGASSGDTEGQWQAPSLLNSWANQGSPWSTAGYLLQDGVTYLQGNVNGGALNTNVFILPIGCRPAAQKRYAVPGSGGTYAQVHVFPSGNVQVAAGSPTTYICLDGISFPVDA